MIQDKILSVRLPGDVKQELRAAAGNDGRKMSILARRFIVEGLKRTQQAKTNEKPS